MSRSRDQSRLAAVRAVSHSRSRAGSHPRLVSRSPSTASVPFLPLGPEQLINPEGAIGEDSAELLQELVYPHGHEAEETLVQEDGGEDPASGITYWSDLPWWKRPSPWWFLVTIPVSSIALAMTIAPRIAVFTYLACRHLKPDYQVGNDTLGLLYSLSASPSADPSSGGDEWQRCASDPVVQAAVAKLSLAMTASMGILGCLTTAFWGSLSDRYGRVKIMGVSSIGVLFSDANFLIVYFFAGRLPGGFWWLILGPLLDGCLGGIGSVSSMIHAYITDCTDVHDRARVFSLFLGLLFAGMSLGPTLGSIMIDATDNIMSVFYLASAMHLAFCLMIWFVCPESLTQTRMEESRKEYKERQIRLRAQREKGGLAAWAGRVFEFLSPLAVFSPTVVDGMSGRKRRDWNLLLLVTGFGCVLSLMGAITYKYQYMGSYFGWRAGEIGYWQSSVGVARAIHLTVILPLLIRFIQRKTPSIQLPTTPSEPLHPERSSSSSASASEDPALPKQHASQARRVHLPKTDLIIIRCSQLLEMSCYIAMGLSTRSAPFTAFSVLGSFGAGFGPAVNSLASVLYAARGGKEMGKLFGAMSVVQTLCAQVLGPALFAFTFMATIVSAPQAIFFLAAGMVFLSFCALLLVRLPDEHAPEVDAEDAAVHPVREETLVEQVLVEVDEDGASKSGKP